MSANLSQKDVFLLGEGEAWFERNRVALADELFLESDPIIAAVDEILASPFRPQGPGAPALLEVGCSSGRRLERLRDRAGIDVYGIETSTAAVEDAKARGVSVEIGTADRIDHPAERFDILVFGFCLYLCDPGDLFGVAAEADRVVKSAGWIIVHVFFSPAPTERPYHHRSGVMSRKMDFRTLSSWHPAYACFSHRVGHHQTRQYDDSVDDWVATSILRKRPVQNA